MYYIFNLTMLLDIIRYAVCNVRYVTHQLEFRIDRFSLCDLFVNVFDEQS